MKDKHYLGVIGILITVAGWMASNATHFPTAYRMVAPQYVNSMAALEKMQAKDFILKKGDRGFTEISELLKRLVSKDPDLVITEIRTMASGYGAIDLPEGMKLVDFLHLEVQSTRSPPQTWEVGGLEKAVKQRYLTINVFLWGSVIFGLGILLSFISIFMKD
ncbi:MAG: hypothetical protein V1758_05060 [Pseudomonadota bacterium]